MYDSDCDILKNHDYPITWHDNTMATPTSETRNVYVS